VPLPERPSLLQLFPSAANPGKPQLPKTPSHGRMTSPREKIAQARINAAHDKVM
jgi:hypothetical protein